MKKMIISVICVMVLVLNLSSVLTIGLKGIDFIGTSIGLSTIDIVEDGSELIYMLEEKGL